MEKYFDKADGGIEEKTYNRGTVDDRDSLNNMSEKTKQILVESLKGMLEDCNVGSEEPSLLTEGYYDKIKEL